MAPASSYCVQFIDTSLFCNNPFALSYPDHKQKWLIRKHLLSLIQHYPSLSLSAETFIHNDGTAANLLNASGNIANLTPPVRVTIWLHENYPYTPPVVFVSSDSASPIHRDHPFVDASGAVASPYLQTWSFPRRNLTELVQNLVNIFSQDHPFNCNSGAADDCFFSHPSLVTKREAVDRLAGMIHYDRTALTAQNEEEIEDLLKLWTELAERKGIIKNMNDQLEDEKDRLKGRVMELMNQADVLMNWVKVNDSKSGLAMAGGEEEDGFEGGDEESRAVIDCFAANKAIDDLLYALDKGLEQGVMTFDEYIRQVRILAREEFYCRDLLVKLRGPHVLCSV